METILPTKYVFNKNNVLTKDKMHVGTWNKIPQWLYIMLWLGIMFLLLVLADFLVSDLVNDLINYKGVSIKKLGRCLVFWIFFVLAISGFLADGSPNNIPYDPDCQFKLLPKSNLIVMQNLTDCPKRENETKGYSYQLYVENPAISGDLFCLAISKDDQINFIDDTEIGKLFASYCYYAQKHNLTDKFINALYFVKDPNTTDINGVPQYVLKGDGITLKIKSNENIAYQIYAVNE